MPAAVVNDEAMQALPDELLGAVTDLRSIVADLREQGTIDGADLGDHKDGCHAGERGHRLG